jgi:hypothetical protein
MFGAVEVEGLVEARLAHRAASADGERDLGGQDLSRVDEDEGASWLLAHTTSLKRLRPIQGDLQRRGSPLKSEEPVKRC